MPLAHRCRGYASRSAGGVSAVILALILSGVASVVDAQDMKLPEGVTDSLIARGERIFHGSANCASCHGDGGIGTEIGPDLTDGDWIRGSGSYDEIVERVTHGVPRNRSKTGTPMPMRGWAGLEDDEVRAVAAYVWTLSNRRN